MKRKQSRAKVLLTQAVNRFPANGMMQTQSALFPSGRMEIMKNRRTELT